MRSITTLRIAVVANLLAIAATIAASIVLADDLPPELAAWVDEHRAGPPAPLLLEALKGVVGMLLFTLVGSVGMLCRKSWGAWCFLVATVAGYITSAMMTGPQVSNHLVSILDDTTVILSGFIIGIAFFSDALKRTSAPPPLPEWGLDEKASQTPNQALQTTPMTRSVYEKTVEFGDPQRGV